MQRKMCFQIQLIVGELIELGDKFGREKKMQTERCRNTEEFTLYLFVQINGLRDHTQA